MTITRWVGIILTTMFTVSSAAYGFSQAAQTGNLLYGFLPLVVFAVMMGLTLGAMRISDYFYFKRLDRREARRIQRGSLLRRVLIGNKN